MNFLELKQKKERGVTNTEFMDSFLRRLIVL